MTGPLPAVDVGTWKERSRTDHPLTPIVYLTSRSSEGAHRIWLQDTQVTVYPDHASSGTTRARILRQALDELNIRLHTPELRGQGRLTDSDDFDAVAYIVGRLVIAAGATNIHLEKETP